MNLARVSIFVAVSGFGLLQSPITAKADAIIDPDSDTLSVLALSGFNMKAQPVTEKIKDVKLSEPADKKDSGEKSDKINIPTRVFDFTELMGGVSDKLTFSPFTIQFFSDLPADLPAGIKKIKGGDESGSGVDVTMPLVRFKMDSSNLNADDNNGGTKIFSDSIEIEASTYHKKSELNGLNDNTGVTGTIPAVAIEFFEPDGKTLSDVVVVSDIKYEFKSDTGVPLAATAGAINLRESRANEAALAPAFSLMVHSDADIPEPGTLGVLGGGLIILGCFASARRRAGDSRAATPA